MGAIWVAASSVYTNQRAAKATNELLTIAQNVRSLYATSQTVDTSGNADMTLSATDATNYTYIQGGIFPQDMVTTSGKAAVDPWNGGVAVTEATVINVGDAFIVAFDQLPQAGCIDMLTANAGGGRDVSLQAVGAGAAGAIPTASVTTFPVVASVAQAQCSHNGNGPSGNAVAFEFRLKS